jgi:hypothetical protein
LYSLHKISVSVLFLFFPFTLTGGNPYRLSPGAAGTGMGSVCIMKPGFWSSFQNPALLAGNKQYHAGINYENRFFIPELGTRSAGVIAPSGRASVGAFYSHFGFPEFRRETMGVACGLKLAEKLSGGVTIDYFSERSSGEYGNNRFLTFEAGLMLRASDKVNIGIHLFNPVPNSLRSVFLPSSISAGAGIKLNESAFAGAGIELSTGKDPLARCGFEYEAATNFRLRGGYCTEFTSFSFGLGYQVRSFIFDLGFATHERLGTTSSVSIIFRIRE